MATTTDRTESTTQSGTDGSAASRSRAAEAYETARERTSSAYSAALDRAGDVSRRTAERASNNPVGAIVGGFALGAVIAALLPKTERETQTFGRFGSKITDAGKQAANSAVEAGREQIDKLTGNAVAQVGSAVVQAVTASTSGSSSSTNNS